MNNIYGIAITAVIGLGTGLGLKLYSDNLKKKQSYKEEEIKLLANGVEIKVDKDIVDEAISTTVERVVTHEVKAACNTAVYKVKADIHRDVQSAVSAVYSDIESDVKKEIEKQLKNLDISDARKEVIRKAKERVAEKFEEDLEEVLDKYNKDLENITKIYSSIAKTVSKEDKGISLKID